MVQTLKGQSNSGGCVTVRSGSVVTVRGDPSAALRTKKAVEPRKMLFASTSIYWDWYNVSNPVKLSRHPGRLPGSRLHGCNHGAYITGESHPCALDTGNPGMTVSEGC